MNIVDIRSKDKNKGGRNALKPIAFFKDSIICEEKLDILDTIAYPYGVKSLWEYNINEKIYKKITGDNPIYNYEILDQLVNEDDSIYYLVKNVKEDKCVYFLYKIDLVTRKEDMLYIVEADKKYDVEIVPLGGNFFLMYYNIEKLDFEMQLSLEERVIIHEQAFLLDVNDNGKYEILDKDLLYGFKNTLFHTRLNNTMHLVFEEYYLEASEKKDLHKRPNILRGSRGEKRIYNDSIRIIPLDKFITEVKEGKEKYSFTILDKKGLDGVVAYEGVTSKYMYYSVKDFHSKGHKLIIINKENMMRKELILDYESFKKVKRKNLIFNLEGKDQRVLFQYELEDRIYNKELIFSNKTFSYDRKLGMANFFVEGKYIISPMNGGSFSYHNCILDIQNDKCVKYDGRIKVIDDTAIIY